MHLWSGRLLCFVGATPVFLLFLPTRQLAVVFGVHLWMYER